jgi:hypothetical protein
MEVSQRRMSRLLARAFALIYFAAILGGFFLAFREEGVPGLLLFLAGGSFVVSAAIGALLAWDKNRVMRIVVCGLVGATILISWDVPGLAMATLGDLATSTAKFAILFLVGCAISRECLLLLKRGNAV